MAEGAIGTARAARSRPSVWTTRMGYAAFAWALLFAEAHVYWAFGGTALSVGELHEMIRRARIQRHRSFAELLYLGVWRIDDQARTIQRLER